MEASTEEWFKNRVVSWENSILEVNKIKPNKYPLF